MTNDTSRAGDNRREQETILILSLGLGLVGLDRFIIMPLFPVMAGDLGLTYQDIGLISAALALTWGLAAIFMGRLADRVGVRAVLVPAALAFSGLVALSAVAADLGGLLTIRALMGFAEGAFVPAAIVAATRASDPTRIGLNIGLLHMAMALFGLGLAPILATQLLNVLPSWRWIFPLVAVPGVLMAYGVRRILPIDVAAAPAGGLVGPGAPWRAAIRPPVIASALAMACWLSGVTIMAALLPSYLTDHLGLPLDRMGFVLSGLGLGGVIGMLAAPALGDRFGYKRVALVATLVHLFALAMVNFVGADVGLLFAALSLTGFAGAGVLALTVGPLTGGAAPPALAATATGIVVGCGEIIGGALAPAVVGGLAASRGIAVAPLCAFIAVAIGLPILAFGVRDPAGWGRRRTAAVTAALSVGLAGCLLIAAAPRSAHAFPVDSGNPDLKINFDNTIKYSAAYRLKSPSSSLTQDVNLDDGDRNFRRGVISNRVDLLTELDVAYKDVGARVSAASWYDSVYNRGNDNDSPMTVNHGQAATDRFAGATRRQMGRNVELLDAFVYGKADIDDMQAAGRAGRHALQWGETLFFGVNGVAGGQAPVDLARLLMTPNAQFKEILRPVNQLSGTLQLNSELSLGAYYQLEWRPTLLPPSGSFLSAVDTVGAGAERMYLPAVAPGLRLDRGSDMKAADSGQGGVRLRYAPTGVDLDLGLYALRFHSKTPQIYVRPGTNPTFPKIGEYALAYHEGVQAYGVSASTHVGDVNVALELSARRNQDLVSSPVNLPAVGKPDADNDRNPAYAVGDTLHGNLSAVYVFGPRAGLWDGGALVGEIGWNRVTAVTSNRAALDPNATRDAVALRFVFEPQYFQVLPGLDLSIPVGVGYNPYGRSRALTNFNGGVERGGDLTVGVNANYLNAWRFGLSYTGFWGPRGSWLTPVNGAPVDAKISNKNSLADRNFIAFSAQRSF